MEVVAVVTGIQTGEETKGAAVEWLSQELGAGTVIRNGGCQAGHHIVKADGREQMFSHFGAATFDGVRTYLKDMVIDPVLLFREADELEKQGVVDALSLLTVDDDCLTITPFHGAYSRLKEMLRDEKKGTVGMGVGDAISDMKRGETYVRVQDFRSSDKTLQEKIESIRQNKISQTVELLTTLQVDELSPEMLAQIEILNDENLVMLTTSAFQVFADLVTISDSDYFEKIMSEPGSLVAEPSHGALLHPYAFAPHTTQVDPTSKNLLRELHENGRKSIKRIGVGRCYMTRHGAGPLISFDRGMTDEIHETHNAANAWANEWLGEFRSGHFDLIATRYALEIAGGADTFDGLMLSYLDVLTKHTRWGVVEGYEYTGEAPDLETYFTMRDSIITGIKVHPDTQDRKHLDHQLRLTALLKECRPLVRYLESSAVKTLEDVFLQYVEEKTGIPVIAISRGPRAEDREKRESWNKVFDSPTLSLSHELYNAPESSERRELSTILQNLYAKVPDARLEIEQAIAKDLMSDSEVSSLYRLLSRYLGSSENAARLVLYLPSQLLPDCSGEQPLSLSAQQFIIAYRTAWKRVLNDSDARASFVDGDLLEPGMGEPKRVRKAAHLIPELLERKIISLAEIEALLRDMSDPELHSSVYEGLSVSLDRELISENEWWQLAGILQIGVKLPEEYSPSMAGSQARQEWKVLRDQEDACEYDARANLQSLGENLTTIEDCVAKNTEVGIRTLDLWVQQLHSENSVHVQLCAKKHLPFLLEKWNEGDLRIQTKIDSLLHHWEKLEIVDQSYLDAFETRSLDRESIEHIATVIAKKIGSHPVLSKYLYPLFLAVGSRVKGYAKFNSDFDGGLVFRPETTWQSREEILARIRTDIPEFTQIGKPLEIWLSYSRGEYGLKSPPMETTTVVNPAQIHFFLNGLWFSADQKDMDIPKALLDKYRDLSRFGDEEADVRTALSRQLEADTVQFRLMHSGYRYHYPAIESKKSLHSDLIDGESTFWDPGYRRVATQRFIQDVYIPTQGKSYDRT